MPATPAWPPDSGVRLFVDQVLSDGATLTIGDAQAHYLANVMRLKPGAHVKLCDDVTGEWRAEIIAVTRRTVETRIVTRLRPREPVPDLWLAVAPIRRARFDWVAEKACELGVARFVPVLTRRAVVDKVNQDRLRAHMVEAAEQCGRTALPEIAAPQPLAAMLGALIGRTLFFADEVGGAPFARAIAAHAGPAAILIGPEGGFDDSERDAIRSTPGAVAVTLGPRILRADTAAVAAVATWLALAI